MAQTKIEWASDTWNPITGCSKISAGCKHCFAERMAKRLAGRYGYPADEPFRVTLHPGRLEEPLHWRKPRRVFVNSMSDLFHPDVPFDFIDRTFVVMALAKRHTFQVLTKRPERMAEYILSRAELDGHNRLCAAKWCFESTHYPKPHTWPLPNVWLGVSVEDQAAADERIPLLLQTSAAVHFVSGEPLLAGVDLTGYLPQALCVCQRCGDELGAGELDRNGCHPYCGGEADPNGQTEGLDWVIVGGESGPGARPMHPDWARSLRDQCQAAGVPFFFKQWGEWFPRDQWEYNPELVLPDDCDAYTDGRATRVLDGIDGPCPMHRVGKKAAGATLDGREWRGFPRVEVRA